MATYTIHEIYSVDQNDRVRPPGNLTDGLYKYRHRSATGKECAQPAFELLAETVRPLLLLRWERDGQPPIVAEKAPP